jgi:hypothetical protein
MVGISVVVCLVFFPSLASAQPCTPNDTREVCVARDVIFMPGVQGVFFAPAAYSDSPFIGGGFQLAPQLWSHNNDNFGPSQGALFVDVSFLQSKASDYVLALYEAGVALSLERNSSRNWLIPYFGSSLGGTLHKELPGGAYVYPSGGVHLYWHQNLIFDIEGGYHFPFAHIDELRGPRAQATLRFSMW